MEVINTLGRRKAAVARVYLSEGKGKITINKRELEDFFPTKPLQYVVNQPLELVEVVGKYDIKINIFGGGVKGQWPGYFYSARLPSYPIRRSYCQNLQSGCHKADIHKSRTLCRFQASGSN